MQDAVLRLDRQLSELFAYLDRTVGLDNVVMTLTADHAVAPNVEFAKQQGFNADEFDEGAWVGALKTRLNEEFGPGSFICGSKISRPNVSRLPDAGKEAD